MPASCSRVVGSAMRRPCCFGVLLSGLPVCLRSCASLMPCACPRTRICSASFATDGSPSGSDTDSVGTAADGDGTNSGGVSAALWDGHDEAATQEFYAKIREQCVDANARNYCNCCYWRFVPLLPRRRAVIICNAPQHRARVLAVVKRCAVLMCMWCRGGK